VAAHGRTEKDSHRICPFAKNTGVEHNKKPEGTGHQTLNLVYLAQPETKETCPVTSKTHPCEQQAIEAMKERYPHLHHRQIQGML